MIRLSRHIGIVAVALCSVLSACGCGKGSQNTVPADPVVPDDPEPKENPALVMSKRLGLGWNLGNQMDAHNNGVADETCWGNPKATQATFDALKANGFSSVRIPVTWMGHIGEGPEYKVEDAWMDRVAELVGYAEKAGLMVIINVHHDGADSQYWLNIKEAVASSAAYDSITAKYKALWKQIAVRFKDKGDFLIFEAFNEIHDGGWGWGANRTDGGAQYSITNKWVQAFVDVVRETGGNNATRYLGIPGYCTNPELTISKLKIPGDSAEGRLLVAVHCYDPYDYTLSCKYDEWGHTAKNNASPDGEAAVVNVMASLKAKFIDKEIPVYFGETGCSNHSDARQREFQRYYLEYFYKACREYGIAPFYWDNGAVGSGTETSAVFNHATGEYINDSKVMVEAMSRAINTEDESYTLESVYNTAP